MPVPPGPVSWGALMQYMARIEPDGSLPLSEVMIGQAFQTFVAVIIPWPDQDVLPALLSLKHRGLDVLAVIPDPASFPAGGPSARALVDSLHGADIDMAMLHFGRDLAEQLSETSAEPAAMEPA
jgi:hypothetical protein